MYRLCRFCDRRASALRIFFGARFEAAYEQLAVRAFGDPGDGGDHPITAI
jgi:hypothetical protein